MKNIIFLLMFSGALTLQAVFSPIASALTDAQLATGWLWSRQVYLQQPQHACYTNMDQDLCKAHINGIIAQLKEMKIDRVSFKIPFPYFLAERFPDMGCNDTNIFAGKVSKFNCGKAKFSELDSKVAWNYADWVFGRFAEEGINAILVVDFQKDTYDSELSHIVFVDRATDNHPYDPLMKDNTIRRGRVSVAYPEVRSFWVGMISWVANKHPLMKGIRYEEPGYWLEGTKAACTDVTKGCEDWSEPILDHVQAAKGYRPNRLLPIDRDVEHPFTGDSTQKDMWDAMAYIYDEFFKGVRNGIPRAYPDFMIEYEPQKIKWDAKDSEAGDSTYGAKSMGLNSRSITRNRWVDAVSGADGYKDSGTAGYCKGVEDYDAYTDNVLVSNIISVSQSGWPVNHDTILQMDWAIPRNGNPGCRANNIIKVYHLTSLSLYDTGYTETLDGIKYYKPFDYFKATAVIPPYGKMPSVSITVASPNGGESFTGNTSQNITWTSVGAVGNVDIAISTNGGTNWATLVSNTANDGSQAVTIPNTPSATCRIRVQEPDGVPSDASNANFAIAPEPAIVVTAPNGGESFTGNTSQIVAWTSVGAVGNVDIAISTNGGTNWATLVSNTANDGSQAVTIPNTPSATCRIRVQEADGVPSDASNANFTITGVPAGTVYYVATNGNDANPGTELQPWKTIQKAANTLTAGQTVYVKSGTYNEQVTVENSGSAGKWITFASYPGQTATIDGTGINMDPGYGRDGGLIQVWGKSYIKVTGFTIINSGYAGLYANAPSNNDPPPHDIIFEGNTIKDSWAVAILMGSYAPTTAVNLVARKNTIIRGHMGGDWKAHETLSFAGDIANSEISGNIIQDSFWGGIDIKDGVHDSKIFGNTCTNTEFSCIYVNGAPDFGTGRPVENIDVYNNTAHNMKSAPDTWCSGINIATENEGDVKNIRVYNNVIYNNPGNAFRLAGYAASTGQVDGVTFENNTIYNNGNDYGRGAFSIEYSKATNTIIRNNIMSQNGYGIQNSGGSVITIDHNLESENPLFVNSSSADFHLQSASPAKDQGSAAGAPNMDFDGNPRPQGAAYDIGAYEYVMAASAYYISKSGNDSNPGTEAQPWLTIQKAANTLAAGDTVYVKAGTYNEHVLITKSGSSGKYITFAAYPGQTPIIDGAGKVGDWDGVIHITSANWIKFVGFTIKNSVWNGIMIDDFGGPRSSHIIIQDNLVRDIGYSGIYAGNSDYITYDGNTVTNTQTNGFGGPANSQQNENVNLLNVNNFEIKNNHVYATANFESLDVKLGCSNGSIHHNDISPTQSAAIYVDAWAQLSQNIDIYDNYIHDSGNAGSRGIVIGAEEGGSAKFINVYNNIVANLPATGIVIPWYSKGNVDSVKIVNNTVYKTDVADKWAGGIGIQTNTNGGTTANIIVKNNIVSQNGLAQISNGIGASATISNNLFDGSGDVIGSDAVSGTPLFVNASLGDFRLQSTSPAIDKGYNAGAPFNADYEGRARPQGSAYDIGAFEYGGVVTNPAITVTLPNGGESLAGNASHTVTWTSVGPVGNVNIDISTNAGTTWKTLVSNTVNDGNQAVTIPNTPSTACRIRIQEPDGLPSDASNADFTITAPVMQSPYGGTARAIPGTIQTEDFDNGGEGVAYHDTDGINEGNEYRPAEGVDIEATLDTGGGYNTGWSFAGEWLEYTVNVAAAGTYDLEARVASGGAGGTFHIEFDGVDKTGPIAVPDTGSYQTWVTLSKAVSLAAGQRVMRIAMDSIGDFNVANINYIRITAPVITVTLPNGGENLAAGAQQTVTWTSAGTAGNVNIDISTNAGTTWKTLVSNTPNDGSQAVTIPNTPSTACRIRVSEPDGSPTDASNSNFTITAAAGYKLQGKVQAYKSGFGISGLSGVTLALSGKASGVYTTKEDGNYEFAGLAGGDYNITPVKSNWRFWPRVMRYTGLSGDKAGQNFMGKPLSVRATINSLILTTMSIAVTPLSENSSESSAISVLVPEEAFSATTDLILTAIEAPAGDKPAMRVVGYGVSIVSDRNLQPVKDIAITMTYDKSLVSGYKEEKLVVGRYDELNQRWMALPTTRYPGESKVVGLSDHLSRFALLELLSADDLGAVKVYPSPYNPAKHPQGMKLEGLTAGAMVKIYTVVGGLVRELKETGGAGSVAWDGRNESGRQVASGVYIAHIKGATGVKKIKLAVER